MNLSFFFFLKYNKGQKSAIYIIKTRLGYVFPLRCPHRVMNNFMSLRNVKRNNKISSCKCDTEQP